MDLENMIFVIPNTFRELEQAPEDGPENAYVVETAMTVPEIEETYEIVDEGIKEAGIDLPPDFIIHNFDVFFHSLKLYTQLAQPLRDRIWQTLRNLYEMIIKDMAKYLDAFTRPERQNMLNRLQMISYLFFTACELNEDRALAFANRPMDHEEAGKKRGRKKQENLVASQIYHRSKTNILKVLGKTLQLKLEQLFEPRIDVNSYVSFCLKYVYTLISNIHSFKDDENLLPYLTGIFELVVERYDHAERFCQKVIELLQNSEELSISLATLVTTLIKKRADGHIVLNASMLMEQLSEIQIADLSKDTSCPKAVSAFLIEVGKECSVQMLGCLDTLELLLDQDSYMIRNAVFEILFIILMEHFKVVADDEAEDVRDRIMDILQDYVLDTNGYCRTRVVKGWTILAMESMISPARYNTLTPIISGRLEDKNNFVRKGALQFLTIVCRTLIPCQGLKQIFGAYRDVYEKLKQQTVKNLREAAGDDRSLEELMKNLPNNLGDGQLDELLVEQDRLDRFTKVMEQIETYDKFHDIISDSLPKIYDMLDSKMDNDVKEAIDFFVMAYNLKLTNSEKGIQRMLLLIRNNSDDIKERLLKAFQAIYMSEKIDYDMEMDDNDDTNDENDPVGHRRRSVGNFTGSADKAKCFREIKNLLVMIRPLNQGELLCVEHLISQMHAKKMFTKTHTDILWCLYRGYIKSSPNDQRWAFVVLGMIAITNPDILLKELDQVLCSFTKMIPVPEGLKPDVVEDGDGDDDEEMPGFDEVTIPDYELAMKTCQVLLRIYPFPTIESGKQFFKLDNDHRIFKAIERLLLKGLKCNRSHPEYKAVKTFFNNFIMKSIEVIYLYAKFPDKIIPQIMIPADTFIREFTLSDAQLDEATSPFTVPDTIPISQATVPNSQATSIVGSGKVNTISLESDHIERFLYLITGIMKGYLLHMGHCILRENQIRKREKDMRKQKEMEERKRRAAARANGGRETRDFRTDVMVNDYSSSDDEEANAEFGGSMGNDSTVLDFIQLQIFDKEVLNNNGYLSKYYNFAKGITFDIQGRRFSRPVRIAAWHAMCNFMIASRDVTKKHAKHFKSCLEDCPDEDIVSILVTYWGDILMRFPNDIEYLNPILFDFLSGKSRLLKSCALKTLSMIILADMLKPTKEIIPMTKLIVDEDAELNNLTRLFFTQVAAKDNQNIYNWLTDVISSHAGSGSEVKEDDFHEMITFLFGLLEKTKSNESLVKKLAERFLLSKDLRLWRDVSFALTLVNYNEKALRALDEKWEFIRATLTNESVNENFQTIIQKVKNQFKENANGGAGGSTKLNELVNDLETKIKAIRATGVDEDKLAAAEEDAKEAAAAAARAAGEAGSDDEDDDATDDDNDEQPTAGDASGTAGRAGSDDNDDDDDELPVGNASRQRQRRRPATTIEPMEQESIDSIESMEELEE